MSKKQDFLRDQQNRDKHPESDMRGSAASENLRGAESMNTSTLPGDRQAAHTGKVDNDHNKMGEQAPTQRNEGRRTPESRHDRQTRAGGPQNVVSARKGGGGAGRNPRGAG